MGHLHRQSLLRRLRSCQHLGSAALVATALRVLAPGTIRQLAAVVEHEAHQQQAHYARPRALSRRRWA
eukprot:1493829-Alexandrium_andersonii.AAC.1